MKHFDSVVTGGAGFIGSHLAERLLKEGCRVTILDNFSNGSMENIKAISRNPFLKVVEEDLKKPARLFNIVKDCEIVFHLAANPEVRVGETDPRIHFEENIKTTFNLVEAMRKAKTLGKIVFASTSAIYGEASEIPTPENYGPLIPISTYGASKLACEALITSYAHTFNGRALILRLANVVGLRSTHGVVADFMKKIEANPRELSILGDGTQQKSYMYIDDCIDAIIHLTKLVSAGASKTEIFNVGSRDNITVKEIARIVAKEMKRPSIVLRSTGGVDGGRGWKGDVKTMQLSIGKLLRTGWKPMYSSRKAVESTVRALVEKDDSGK